MKSVLVPVETNPSVYPLLEVAVLLEKTYGARIEGRPSTYDIPMMVTEIGGTWPPIEQVSLREQGQAAGELFATFMASRQVEPATAIPTPGGYLWHGGSVLRDSEVGTAGRIYDAIVVGRPDSGGGYPRYVTFESALFESGRPLVVAPPQAPTRIGSTIVIHWNASTETARTISHAMRVLEKAERVVVLTIEGAGLDGPSGQQLAEMLRLHGIRAEAASREGTSRNAGELILDFAASQNADLLIKGAYTQSRLRQMIFGGATSHILAEAKIPVFMAH